MFAAAIPARTRLTDEVRAGRVQCSDTCHLHTLTSNSPRHASCDGFGNALPTQNQQAGGALEGGVLAEGRTAQVGVGGGAITCRVGMALLIAESSASRRKCD